MPNTLLFALFLFFGFSAPAEPMPEDVKKVSVKYGCTACHNIDTRLVGPSWKEVAKKKYSAKKMGQLIRNPKPENWPGYPAMAPIANITDQEVKIMADWLSSLK